jgi:aminopeptidase YwaD
MTPNKILCVLIFLPIFAFAGKPNKKQVAQLTKDISYLASDSLEGRRMGTPGEKLAYEYITKRFKETDLAPFFDGNYTQAFTVQEGKKLSENTIAEINNEALETNEYAPMPFGADGTLAEMIMNTTNEQGSAVLIPISKITTQKLASPHDTALSFYMQRAEKEINNGAKAIIFYNDIDAEHDYSYDGKTKSEKNFDKPCVFINFEATKKLIVPSLKKDWIDFNINIETVPNLRVGKNVAAYIDNEASETIVVGAHYDHLGYGEDHNSLFTGTTPQIHNGADDNASGVAAMLALAKQIKNKGGAKYNYIFIAFSGEELGLYGSKKFIELNESKLKNINCMINIDMLGRYDNDKKALTIGGVGTSPSWIPMIEKSDKFFTVKYDSAGVGPSDHTSFYLKNIPVLFFFTGLHTDYHKPSDDANKINFAAESELVDYIASLVKTVSKQPKLSFSKTREPKMEGTRFKVTLGIMPDYTYSGEGVRADGISEGKPAMKAGLKANDIIIQLGDTEIADIQVYMQALAKFKYGDATTVTVLRGKETLIMNVKFGE